MTLGRDAAEQFIKEMKAQKRLLPKIPGKSYHSYGFDNSVTPYLEMIELAEFYPVGLIPEEEGQEADE